MADQKRIVILSPLDVKPGSIAPDGRVVKSAHMWVSGTDVLVAAMFEDETQQVFMWPSGTGWTVDGRVG